MRLRRWRRVTLRTRITWAIAVAVLASSIATTFVAYQLERNGTRDRFLSASAATADADVAAVDLLVKGQPTPEAAITTACNYFMSRVNGFALFYDSSIDDKCNGGTVLSLPEAKADAEGHFNFWLNDGHTWATLRLITVGRKELSLVEYYDFSPELAQLQRLRNNLLVLDAAAVVVAVAFGLLIAGGIGRPIARVTKAFRRLSEGDLDTRIPERGGAELATLAHEFNSMADQLNLTLRELRASQTLQSRFVSDVSHEIRSPLAAMVAANDGLDSVDPALRTRAVTLVQAQTRRMSRMIEDLLEMSRFDAGQATLEVEPVQLTELVDDVVRTVAPDCDVRVLTLGDADIDVDARRLHAILRNLVGNAIQHGAPPVDIVIDARADPVVVTVADDGPGVPADLAPTVFDRFVRADTARTSHAATGSGTSTGLGLAIAAENARLHGATLEVSTTGRSAFTLRLPRQLH